MDKSKLKTLLALHVLLMVYSCSGIFSKLAAQQEFLSFSFFACWFAILALLAVYALGWQQIIKRLPLTTAFANKAITVIWGIIWGAVFFHESITPLKIIGALVVICGVVLFVRADNEDADGAAPHDASPTPSEEGTNG